METLLLARAKYLLDRVSNNVKYRTLDGSPALPAEAAALIECLGKLGLVEDADAMRKDFIVYFAHEVRLPNTGLDPRLVEFVSTANERFGPFLKYSGPEGDCTVVRLRLIDHFEGLRITFKKLSMLSSPLTPPEPGTGKDEGKAGTTTQAEQADERAAGGNDSDTPPKTPSRTEPTKPAWQAYYIRETLGITKQSEIAEQMTREGTPAVQGQVSKWLRAVDAWLKAGGIKPTMEELHEQPKSIDPAKLDMGARQDGRTPSQRGKMTDPADDWD